MPKNDRYPLDVYTFLRHSFIMELSPKARHLLVREILDQGQDISEVARKFGISRVTVYKWLKREKEGRELNDKERVIERYWHQAPVNHEGAVISLVEKHPEWGIRTLVKNLPKVGNQPILGHHGVQNVLRRHNLNTFELRSIYAYSRNTPATRLVSDFIKKISSILGTDPAKRWRIVSLSAITGLSTFATIVFLGIFTYIVRISGGVLNEQFVGQMFSLTALFVGSIFFLYSFKYYITLAIVLSFSQKNEDSHKYLGLQSNLEGIKLKRHPFISVHIPFYNEKNVVERAIRASASFKYEGDYEIILCDDSTDETTQLITNYQKDCLFKGEKLDIVENKIEGWTLTSVEIRPGVTLKHLHREKRDGFKGAALQLALKLMNPRTEYISVFDADFVPYPDTLQLFLKYFVVNSEQSTVDRVAAVQGYQWHVLNKSENWITRGVRSEYSGSYVVERSGAEIYGGLKQISGSVYMIKKDVLAEIGWGTSITEDFELTLKLYEKGYKVLYTPYVQAPAECVSTLKRLIRQRMRWAEGHSFNVKKMFRKLIFSPNLTFFEKLELVYLAPYYLQAFFFLVGTLTWLISETVFKTHLPFWTELWGWSLILTNMIALPLLNSVGLFLEESEERDYMGLGSFVALSYILVPFQAYAAVKGFLEKEEGTWFRTPKTGRITDVFARSGLMRFITDVLPASVKTSISKSANFDYLTLKSANNRFNNFKITPKNVKWVGNFSLSIFVAIAYMLVQFSPYVAIKNDQPINNFGVKTVKGSDLPKENIESQVMVQMQDTDVIFHKEPRIRYKRNNSELEITTQKLTGIGKFTPQDVYKNGPLITYKVDDNLSLLYRTWDEKINESFVIGKYYPLTEIVQSIKTTDYVLGTNDKGEINVAPKEGGYSIYTFEKPFMYEQGNTSNKSFGIDYKLEKTGEGSYTLKKVLNSQGKAWLSDPNRKFPVVIDPTIYKSTIVSRGEFATNEVQFGSNQNKLAYMPNATGGPAWYLFHANGNIINYRKCFTSTGCDEDGEWSANVAVDVNGDIGDYNPTIWVKGDTIWTAWIDDATAGGANAIDSLQFRSLDTTNDTFGTECSSADQGSLDNTNYPYIAVGDNGDVVVGYSDTAGDAEADTFEVPTGTCTFTSIETGSGLPASTTNMKPVALALGNKIHIVYDDAANEIRHSVRDVSTDSWDSADTVADGGNVLDDKFSVTTDGSSLWLLYSVDATNTALRKCASPCTTTWTGLTSPFTSSDLTSADYPNISYISGSTQLKACINNGASSTTQDVICKTSDASSISWGSSAGYGFMPSDYTELNVIQSTTNASEFGVLVRDNTYSLMEFASDSGIRILAPQAIANTEAQFGSNQRKIAYMPNATGGAAWYAFHADANVIKYRKCFASTNCDHDSEWSANVSVDANGDVGDYNPNISVQGDSILVTWIDDATAGGTNAIDSLQFRILDTTNDTFGTECSSADQGTLDNTNFAYGALASNGDVVAGYSDTAGDAEADIWEIPTGTCTFTSIEAGSGLPTGTTTMRPVALALGNKVHVVYDDAANEIRHSVRDVSTNAWDSSDTVADGGNVLDDIFSVATDGSSLWLLYMQDATTSVLRKCASPCTTTWTGLTAPFTSSDLTSADYPNIAYTSSDTGLTACINNGSATTAQDIVCKGSSAGTISWGSSFPIGFGASDYSELSMTMSAVSADQLALAVRDSTKSTYKFATVPERGLLLLILMPLLPFIYIKLRKLISKYKQKAKDNNYASQKKVFATILATLTLLLIAFPMMMTFNDILARIIIKTHVYTYIQDWIIPFETRLVGVMMMPFGFRPVLFGDYLGLGLTGATNTPFLIEIAWNCLGLQSLIFFGVTAFVGLQGNKYTNFSKIKALLIGFLGTVFINLFRILAVAFIAYYIDQSTAVFFHNYVANVLVLAWLAFYWWFMYAFVLEEKSLATSQDINPITNYLALATANSRPSKWLGRSILCILLIFTVTIYSISHNVPTILATSPTGPFYLYDDTSSTLTGTTAEWKLVSNSTDSTSSTSTTVSVNNKLTAPLWFQYKPGITNSTAEGGTSCSANTPDNGGWIFDTPFQSNGSIAAGNWSIFYNETDNRSANVGNLTVCVWKVTISSGVINTSTLLFEASDSVDSWDGAVNDTSFTSSQGAMTLTSNEYLYVEIFSSLSTINSAGPSTNYTSTIRTGPTYSNPRIVTPTITIPENSIYLVGLSLIIPYIAFYINEKRKNSYP